MRSEEQGVDRRRALGIIGKASAVAAVVAVPTVASGRSAGKSSVDVATARREFDAGADAIPMHEIFPDQLTREQLVRSEKLLQGRINRVVDMLLEHQTERQHLITAKFPLLRARKEVRDLVAEVGRGSLRAAEARAKARTTFDVFFREMKALGARA